MGNFSKRGLVKISAGKYIGNDGKEKTKYLTVGEYFSSDGGNRQAIKMNATAFSDEKWLNIYLDEGVTPNEFSQVHDEDRVINDIPDEPINLDNIPF